MKTSPLAATPSTSWLQFPGAIALAVLLVMTPLTTQPSHAQAFKILYSFPQDSNGSPSAGLLLDSSGNLYGTAAGSACFAPTYDYGNVFKIDSSGAETVLTTFNSTDGMCPFDGLIKDEAGNLYGTTLEGGTYGDGNVFKVDPSGNETDLYSFNAGPNGDADGCYPHAALLRDSAGNLYGTTSNCGAYRRGTVFKIDTSGNETVLHNFTGLPWDGAYPYSGLTMNAAGNFFGTAEAGGFGSTGVLYKLTPKGRLKVLHSFNEAGGCNPAGTPLMDSAGNFYGTTMNCLWGAVWKISKDGVETTLHSFSGGSSDGANPSDAGLISDSQGNLYGVTTSGGRWNDGTVYKVAPNGAFTLLHVFGRIAIEENARGPQGSLVMDVKGNLYGTTYGGGSGNGNGTVWKLTPRE